MRKISTFVKRVLCCRLDEDVDLLKGILDVIYLEKITSGSFFLIGALKKAEFGFYKNKKYTTIVKNENLEILSCIGNISLKKGTQDVIIHCHIALADQNGNSYGGHVLNGCIISPVCELIVFEFEHQLHREFDEKTNLNLLIR